MPRTTLERNSFVRGLITEASPLTFPENASLDENNFVLNRDGSRQRRFGMDYENLFGITDTTKNAGDFNNLAVTAFRWENVGDDATITVGVIQTGNILHILDLSTTNPSDNVITTLTLATKYNNVPLQYASVKGVLVMVSSQNTDGPQYLQRSSGGVYSVNSYPLEVRDIWGVDDGLEVDERPGALDSLHEYNLLNQGWTSANITAVGFPSNADIMQYGKNNTDDFSKAQLDKQFFGNTPAVKGKFIINAYNRGASRVSESGVAGLPSDTENGRCTTLAAYAGRMFYAGVNSNVSAGDDNSPSYTGTIFFSGLVRNVGDLGKCFQEADPTSEHISDLLATDGGTIDIPEASNIYKLVTRDTSIVVIAENGVWEITGPDGVFRADDFSISRVTNVGAIGPDSVVNAENNILYWSEGGIYVLSPNDVTGRLAATNLTESTIQTFFNTIPPVGKLHAKGHYDAASRKLSWLYNDTDAYDGTTQTSNYNRELVFDTVLQAFYTNTINSLDTDSPYVAAYMPVTDFITIQRQDFVVVNGVQVQVNGEDVVVTTDIRSSGDSTTKYVTIIPTPTTYNLTLSNYGNLDFLDWESADNTGVDAPAYLVTGYELFADSQRRKYVPYITTHFKRTETGFTDTGNGNLVPIGESGCLIQAQWDFANSANSGKWGTQFQAYRLTRPYMPSGPADTFDYGHVMITTKSRLRGSGKALSLKFDTEAGKDLHIYGWALLAEGNEFV